jgi:GDP-L-fucose synthase
MIQETTSVYIAGHKGLAGSAILRVLIENGFKNVITKTHAELELKDRRAVYQLFESSRPEIVILAAAKVGGIGANTEYPVEFLLENLEIQNNVISAAAQYETKTLVFLGSSCIYPKKAIYPLTEDQLLSGPFEPTNEAYAIAKVAGVKLCEFYRRQYNKNFFSLMPTNLYGPNDFYDFQKSHVIPSLLLKILRAKQAGESVVTLWGSGEPLREFLHADDLARAVLACLRRPISEPLLNVGSGEEISIASLANLIANACRHDCEFFWDKTKPDGIHRKVLDSSKIRALNWQPRIRLMDGLPTVVSEAQSKLESLLQRSQEPLKILK